MINLSLLTYWMIPRLPAARLPLEETQEADSSFPSYFFIG